MKKLLTAALCAASMMLASGATTPTPSPGTAANIGAGVRQAMSLAKRRLPAARYAATAAEQLAALKQAEAATATIETKAGGSRSGTTLLHTKSIDNSPSTAVSTWSKERPNTLPSGK
jgi:hypothetical protein